VTDLVTKSLAKACAVTDPLVFAGGNQPEPRHAYRHGLHGCGALVVSGGRLRLWALAAWIMALLDTVDGKWRVSHRSSTFGEVLDHGMDLLHPPFWYLAWMYGLEKIGQPLPEGWFRPTVWLIFSTYVLVRLCEGYFIRRFGFHLHVWRRFDSFFRLIVARRNPNLILLTCGWLIGRPDLGLLSLVVWQLVALIVHVLQIVNAEWLSRHSKLRSWLEVAAEAFVQRSDQ
jgi:phosphatidylglycerophosphate synthase